MKKDNIYKNKPFSIGYLAIILSILGCLPTKAQITLPAGDRKGSEIRINIKDISQNEGNINVALNLEMTEVNMPGNLETIYKPMYVNGADTLRFAPFAIAGRNRWYDYSRNGQDYPMVFRGWGESTKRYRGDAYSGSYDSNGVTFWSLADQFGMSPVYDLQLSAPYQDWMEEAVLVIDAENIGCANCMKGPEGLGEYPLAQNDFVVRTFTPEFIYVTPVAEAVKTRELAARAYVDFKVNQIVIIPDYRRNRVELGKIIATIDSIKNDPDITVRSLHISGTASPEGSYSNNVYLAENRTIALKNYVQNLYHFAPGFITTSYEPVDWAGLKEWLRKNEIENKEGILDIVNGGLAPEAKNTKIKTTYPTQYKWLLENVYPALRHSDYIIRFEIKSYTSAGEILDIMETAPQKLSLAELFVGANSVPQGSDKFVEAFEIAVRMYPDDPTANLNAAVTAISRGEYDKANGYLAKAGESDEVLYTKAMLDYINGNEASAVATLKRLVASSSQEVSSKANSAVESIKEMHEHHGNYRILTK